MLSPISGIDRAKHELGHCFVGHHLGFDMEDISIEPPKGELVLIGGATEIDTSRPIASMPDVELWCEDRIKVSSCRSNHEHAEGPPRGVANPVGLSLTPRLNSAARGSHLPPTDGGTTEWPEGSMSTVHLVLDGLERANESGRVQY